MSRVVVLMAVVAVIALLFWVDPLAWRAPEPPTTTADPPPDLASRKAPTLDVPRPQPEEPMPAELGPDVDLDKVDRARDLHGIVVLRDGSPVAGASVVLTALPWSGFMLNSPRDAEVWDRERTRTGPRGTFRLRLREGDRGILRVGGRRFHQVSAGERIRVVLDDAVTLKVRVKTPDGRAATGVEVLVSGAGAGWGPGAPAHTETNAEGVAEFAGLRPGEAVYVWIGNGLRAGWGRTLIQRLTLPAEGTREHEIELPAGRTLRGVVTDATTGEPLPEAMVGMGWQMDPIAAAGDAGGYILHGWTGVGVREVTASAPGYVRGRLFPDPQSDELDFALVKGATITGRVVDASGAPIHEARVAIVGSVHAGGTQTLSLGHGYTHGLGRFAGEPGRFAIDGLAPDMPLSIQVRAVGHARRIVDIDAVRATTHDVGDIVLPPAITIAGTVVRTGGTPAARIPVRIFGANPDRAARRADKVPPHRYYGTREDIVTDDLGRFTVSDMCAGAFEIIVKPRAPLARTNVTLDASQQRVEVTIEIGETRTLRVTVLKPDGKPLTHGMVSARHPGGAVKGRLDTQGQTELEIPVDVKHVIVVPFGGEARANYIHEPPVPVPGTADTLVIRLRRALPVRGVVVKPDGSPFTQALVVGTVKGVRKHHVTTDKFGRFSMKVTDEVDLSVDGQVRREGRSFHEPFVGGRKGVEAGTQDVRIETDSLEGHATLTVRVLGPDGPLEGLDVMLSPYQPSVGRQTSDADGVARFENLSRIERTVKAQGTAKDGSQWPAREVKATPGGAEVTIHMTRPVLATGIVLGPHEKPVQGAILSVRRIGEHRPLVGGMTPEDGTFTFGIPSSTALRFIAHKVIDDVFHMAEHVVDGTPTERIVLKLKPRKR